MRELVICPTILLFVIATWTLLVPGRPAAAAPDAVEADQADAGSYDILQQRDDRIVAVLPNRMIVVAQELPTAPVVSTQVWVKTGSIYEQEHVGAGLSHFLEHLLSGGSTSTRPESESNALLGTMGARVNAATSFDTVRYYINTTKPHTSTAISLISDWLKNNLITEEEYARERDVIQREFDMGRGEPSRIMWKLTQRARYGAHPARHPIIGYIDEFMSITRDEIYDFYRRMYVPNNMVFVVVGDIDKQQVLDQIAGIWSQVETGELPALAFPQEPQWQGGREVSGKADIQRPRLRLIWPSVRLGETDQYPLDVLAVILGQGESSALVRSLRDAQALVTTVSAYNYTPG